MKPLRGGIAKAAIESARGLSVGFVAPREEGMNVQWVRRNWPIAPVPHIQREDGLPSGQRILVFLPHSDDGRYFGVTLMLLNRAEAGVPRNEVRIVVVASGYRGVATSGGVVTKEQKTAVRKSETVCWAETLGFAAEQVTFFEAEETYESRTGVLAEDQRRMNEFIRTERPTMVFIPHISDTAQHINHFTRQMVLEATTAWIEAEHAAAREANEVFLVEYPTNHVPILPPSDKNLIMAFSDPGLAQVKHEANKAHRSQVMKGFEMIGKFIEASDALREADDVDQFSRAGRRFSRYLSGVAVNPRQSRGEHFGVTRLRIEVGEDAGPLIVEQRLSFPLSPVDLLSWRHAPSDGRPGEADATRGSQGRGNPSAATAAA